MSSSSSSPSFGGRLGLFVPPFGRGRASECQILGAVWGWTALTPAGLTLTLGRRFWPLETGGRLYIPLSANKSGVRLSVQSEKKCPK